MELATEVKGVFQRRQARLLHSLMTDFAPLVSDVQSAKASENLVQLDEYLGVFTELFESTVGSPGDLLNDLCEFLRTFSPYFDLRGLFHEQLEWAQNLIKYFREHATSEEDAVDMSLLLVIANMFHRLGEHDDALEIYNFVLSIDRHRATHPGFALTYHNMALVYLSRGDIKRGIEACRRSLEIDQHNENEKGIAGTLMLLADFLEEEGDVHGSARTLQQALDIIERLDNRVLQTSFTGKLAAFSAKYNSPKRADELFQQAIAGWKDIGDEEQLAITQFNYAVMLHETGNVDMALRLARESLSLLEVNGHFRENHLRAVITAWENGDDAPPSVPSQLSE